MARRTIRFKLYTIHAHIGNVAPDYINLLQAIPEKFLKQDGDIRIAVGSRKLLGNRLFLVLYKGGTEKDTLNFNWTTYEEFMTTNLPGTGPARKTRVVLDAIQRRAVIESGRECVSAEEFAKIVETKLRTIKQYGELKFSLAPVAPEFAQSINRLSRIQSASVSLLRPNADWTDNLDELTKIASDSNGGVIDVGVRAGRGDSLSKELGIVPSIKAWVAGARSAVAKAIIKGQDSESKFIELKLSDYTESFNLSFQTTKESSRPSESEIESRLTTHLNSIGREDV